jgi:hypothetical protein
MEWINLVIFRDQDRILVNMVMELRSVICLEAFV